MPKLRMFPGQLALRRLVRMRGPYGNEIGRQRLEILRILGRRSLRSVNEVQELHEQLCFLYAYPDDEAVSAQVERMLQRSDERSDLKRFKADWR